jgi:2-polyprenyl-6-methoxyphenol hydroxylase-like FAD-dependent oxidoreductase
MDDYDVVVVGGSLAGCSTARLLALRGAKVALIEKRPGLDAYKVTCTHYIQAGASPAMDRLGLTPLLEAAGAVANKVDVWTRWGWMRGPDNGRHGWSLRRSTLDPMVRKLAAETPGVDYMPGLTAVGVLGGDRTNAAGQTNGAGAGSVRSQGRVRGVEVADHNGDKRALQARLVVAADGRESSMGRLARVPARIRANGRFGYYAYFEDVPLRDPNRALFWFGDPDTAYVFPYEHGITGITMMPAKARMEEFRRDPETAVRAYFRTLPDAPDLDQARRTSKWFGKLDMPNALRPATARGMAFVGDAAQASDPIWGVGCGWAFQSAEWLAEELGAALHGSERDLDRGLAAYARHHRRELAGHHLLTSDYSSGRGFTPVERLLFTAVPGDPALEQWMEDLGTRSVRAFDGFPGALARAARVGLRAVA